VPIALGHMVPADVDIHYLLTGLVERRNSRETPLGVSRDQGLSQRNVSERTQDRVREGGAIHFGHSSGKNYMFLLSQTKKRGERGAEDIRKYPLKRGRSISAVALCKTT